MNKPTWCVMCLGWEQAGGVGWARKTQDRLVSVGQKDQYRAEVEGKEEKASENIQEQGKGDVLLTCLMP